MDNAGRAGFGGVIRNADSEWLLRKLGLGNKCVCGAKLWALKKRGLEMA